jgi:hypothetical protein
MRGSVGQLTKFVVVILVELAKDNLGTDNNAKLAKVPADN